MRITYDATTDAATIFVSDESVATESSVGDQGVVARGADGGIVFIEIYADASQLGLPASDAAERIVTEMRAHFAKKRVAS